MNKGSRLLAAILVFSAIAGAALAAETITYTYDAHGRLVRVAHTGAINNNVVANFSYDATDNRNIVSVTGSP